MNRFRNFFNKKANNSKIFSREEIKNMTSDEFRKNEKAIDYQMSQVGVPTNYELNLEEPENTKLQGTMTGAASDFEGMTRAGKFQSKLYEDVASERFPNSSKFVRNGMHGLFDAKMDPQADVHSNLDRNIKDENLKNLMKKDFRIPSNSMGVHYKKDSSTSKSFAKSPEIEDFIKNNYDDLKSGKIPKAPINWDGGLADAVFNPEKFDRHSSVQNATLYNPKLDENGNFSSTIVDYYDFEKRKKTLKNMPNNWGYDMQQGGLLKNYYNLIDIERKYKK